ncbi:hypothetical protein HZY83_04645 [Gemella sp. GH3]|uniref:hypothetical protein n=1 Tax=unclassified Gemella TaxID=2624949 RepID=UPI0015D085BA|nr:MULTISPECIES: hypothetical protein [unclassified Gemella]MBF0713970.1 hypothetical protein [Gemella sp. GH3.1]NYS50922.1 hypothetical protein [Gemella sp. GH3]
MEIKISTEQIKLKYKTWYKKYIFKFLIVSLFCIILSLINNYIFKNEKLYMAINIIFLFYFIYTVSLGAVIFIKFRKIIKENNKNS